MSLPMGRAEVVSRLWDYLTRSIFGATAHAFEASSIWKVHSSLPEVLYGHEGATFDIGFLIVKIKENLQFIVAPSDRLEQARKIYPTEHVVLAMEFKHINTILSKIQRGGLYFSRFLLQSSQEECTVVLVKNPIAPDLIACVPRSYLKGYQRESDSATVFLLLEAPLVSSVVPPFPMELSPFVLPDSRLEGSLASLLAFAHGLQPTWSNPYNDIQFHDFKISSLVPVSKLFTCTDHMIRDQPIVQLLRDACKSPESKYTVSFPDIRPCGGDLIVTHSDSEDTLLIEIKRGTYQWKVNAATRTFFFQIGGAPILGWDGIMLVSRDATTAVVLARDECPFNWLRDHANKERSEFTMTHSVDFWEKRTIRFPPTYVSNHAELLSRQFAQVFDYFRSEGMMPAKNQVPTDDAGWSERLLQGPRYRQSIYDRYFIESSQKQPTRGEGRKRAPMLIEANRAMEIEAQCRETGFGNLYRLGTHPNGTYAFCDGPYTGDKNTSFYDLDLDTPMLYVNFVEVDHLGRYHPHDDRACLSFIHCTHGSFPSIYVIQTRTRKGDPTPPLQYLVPSETLATEERRQENDDFINKGKEAKEITLFLSEGELLDCYRTPRSKTLAGLRTILRQCALADEVQIGRGIKVLGQDYVTTRRAVMEGFLEVSRGLLPWKRAVEVDEDDLEELLEDAAVGSESECEHL